MLPMELTRLRQLSSAGNQRAFTLTEVLLAIAIVGIIAALVLPMIVKDYQTKTLDAALKREKQTIESSIASLLINENTDDYNKTMLYTGETDPSSYANTSGRYITKYLKVSKYCGDNNGDCFASKYYKYESGDKSVYTPTYKGACASLKNGSSICMEPKNPTHGVKILLDINGKKGPNIKGRDLHEYEIPLPDKGGLDRTSNDVTWDYRLVDIKPVCSDGDTSEECCESNFSTGCCTAYPEKYGSRAECKTCSATKGTDAECCTISKDYANAHKSSCCSNIKEYFDDNQLSCCSLKPANPWCPQKSACETYPDSWACCKTKDITDPLDKCCNDYPSLQETDACKYHCHMEFKGGNGKVNITVTGNGAKYCVGMAIKYDGGKNGWLPIIAGSERSYNPKEIEQFCVNPTLGSPGYGPCVNNTFGRNSFNFSLNRSFKPNRSSGSGSGSGTGGRKRYRF